VNCKNGDKNGVDGKAKGNIQKKEKEQSTQPLADTAAVVNGAVNGDAIELDAKTGEGLFEGTREGDGSFKLIVPDSDDRFFSYLLFGFARFRFIS